MVLLFRAVAVGLLTVAIVLHVVGFVTHHWIGAKLDMRGIGDIMGANEMGSIKANQVGISINMGLWKYCMKSNMGQMMNAISNMGKDSDLGGQGTDQDMIGQGLGENSDGQEELGPEMDGPSQDDLNQGSDFRQNQGDFGQNSDQPESDSRFGTGGDVMDGMPDMNMCQKPASKDVPGWMKGVRALGILSMIVAVLGLVGIFYGCLGDGKGDRARLLPFITAGICVIAGVLLLIAVAVFGAEYLQMMDEQVSNLSKSLMENVRKNTGLGFSFALEAVAGVLMLLTSLVLMLPGARGAGASFSDRRNMAV